MNRALNHLNGGLVWPVELSRFWTLLTKLVARDIRARYRRTAFGMYWILLQPILYTAVFAFLRSVAKFPQGEGPYVLMAYLGITAFLFFAAVVNGGESSIVRNAGIIKKMGVNRLVFPVAAAAAALVDYLVASSLVALLMVLFRLPPSLALLWIPVVVALLVALALGIALLVAATGIFRRDVILVLPYALQALMFLSPIIYPLSAVPPEFYPYYLLNPLVGVVESLRAVVIGGVSPDPLLLGISAIWAAVIWCIALPLFRFTSKYFADVI